MKHRIKLLAYTAAIIGLACASSKADVSVIPKPAIINEQAGTFTIKADAAIAAPSAATNEATFLADALRPATGFKLPVTADAGPAAIRFDLEPTDAEQLEGAYSLDVTPAGITIRSTNTAGLFYGVETLRQLLPAAALGSDRAPDVQWTVPCVHIEDRPQFAWRGLMLDTARHYFPASFVKRFIDLAALHKFNRFHWHLTDDQGWRLEIKKYPRLTEIGSKRASSPMFDPANPKKLIQDNQPYGGFYTQDEVRDIVAYAAARHVIVIPEIEMPGHSAAAICAYPELGITVKPTAVRTVWGVETNILNPNDATLQFEKDVLTEVMGLFPSHFIHCGGDEVPKVEWKKSPAVQAQIKSLGLKDEEALQGWFMGQINGFLKEHGRQMIGWDEILDGGLSPGSVVMSWRGANGAIKAAQQNYQTINASDTNVYLDYSQSKSPNEPRGIGGYIPLAKVYSFHPAPASLTPEQQAFVLGGQGQLWSEYLLTPDRVEYMAYPRACALAEVLWTSESRRDFDDFQSRLAVHVGRLTALKVNFRALDPTPATAPAATEKK